MTIQDIPLTCGVSGVGAIFAPIASFVRERGLDIVVNSTEIAHTVAVEKISSHGWLQVLEVDFTRALLVADNGQSTVDLGRLPLEPDTSVN